MSVRDSLLSWSQQPQEAVGINPAWGLSPELVWSAAPVDDQIWTPGGAFPQVVTAAGRGLTFTGGQSVGMTRQGRPNFAATKFTAVVVFDWTSGASNNYPQLLQLGGPENCGFIVGALSPSGGDIALVKGGVSVVGSGLALTSGVTYVLVMSHDQVSGEYYALLRPPAGGATTRDSANNTAVSYNSVSGVMAFGIGRRDLPVSWNGSVYFAFASYDFLPEAGGRELLHNPWALIEGRSIYVPPSVAALAPNITAVYADSVTASSVTPRVTLDFA